MFELDEEYLDEQILYQEQELEIQQLNMDDIESQQSVSEQQKANEQASASEQYSFTVSSANLSLSRAKEALQEAKDELAAYREESGTTSTTADSSVESALMQAVEEKTEDYIAAQQELLSLQWRIENAVNEALQEAQSSASLTGTSAVKTQSSGEEAASEADSSEADSNAATDETAAISDESDHSSNTGYNAAGTEKDSEDDASILESEDSNESIVLNENTNSGFIESIETESDGNAGTDTSENTTKDTTERATETEASDSAIILDEETESHSSGSGTANSDLADSDSNILSDSDSNETGEADAGDSASSDSATNATQSKALTQSELDAIEAAVRASYSSDLIKTQEAVDAALAAKEAAEAALEEYEAELLAASGASASATESELIAAVKSAQEAYEDAALSANEATVSAARSLASANLADASDSTLRQQEIAYERMERTLNQLKTLKETGGKVYATADGIVTKINLTVGEKTSDSPAIMMADTSKGLRFTAELSEEEQQYIGAGDLVTLSWNSTKLENVEVTSVTADDEQDDVYNIVVQLPDDSFDLGAAVTLEFTKKSSNYSLCVPLSALYLDENNQPYVFVTEEYETVMGTETRVRSLSVVILEKDSSYAAIEEGTLSSVQQVITSSDKSISDGSRVRVEE